jgi:hypothetical protein
VPEPVVHEAEELAHARRAGERVAEGPEQAESVALVVTRERVGRLHELVVVPGAAPAAEADDLLADVAAGLAPPPGSTADLGVTRGARTGWLGLRSPLASGAVAAPRLPVVSIAGRPGGASRPVATARLACVSSGHGAERTGGSGFAR